MFEGFTYHDRVLECNLLKEPKDITVLKERLRM